MFTTMQLWTPSVPVLLVLAISSLQVILSGAAIAVGTSSPYADEGSNHNTTCTPSEAFRFLRWFKSSKNQEFADAQRILEYIVFANSVTFDPSVNASHYSFNEGASNYPLTIKGVGLDDELSYWCDVELDSGSKENDKTSFKLRQPVTSDKSSVTFEGDPVNSGDTLYVEVGVSHDIKITVTGILPSATFTWMLGSTLLPETTVNTTSDDGLITSTSTASWAFAKGDVGEALTCTASNGAPEDFTVQFTIGKKAPEPSLSIVAIIGIAGGSLCGVAVAAVGGIAGVKYYKKTKVTPDSNQSKKGEEKKADGGKADV